MFSIGELRDLLPNAVTKHLDDLAPSEIQAHVKYPPLQLDCDILYNVEVISVADQMKTIKLRLEESKLEKIQEEISKIELSSLENPETGGPCLIKVNIKDLPSVCRGLIILSIFNSIYVYTVDFGQLLEVPGKQIYKIPESLSSIPFQVFQVSLAGIEELEVSDSCVEAFNSLLTRNAFRLKCKVVQSNSSSPQVVLYDAKGQCVRDFLLERLHGSDTVHPDSPLQDSKEMQITAGPSRKRKLDEEAEFTSDQK